MRDVAVLAAADANQFNHGLTNDSDVVVEAFVSNAWLGA
jgi:hypothetical protein